MVNENKECSIFLSAIIPTYNSSDIIEHTIKKLYDEISSYQQTFEIIIVNDGSTDRTTEIIQQICLLNNLSNIRIIENIKNYGQSVATINGLRVAKGKYIVILDDDLQYAPYQIQFLLNKILSVKDEKMICGYKINEKKSKSAISVIAIKISMLLLKVYFNRFYSSNYFTPFKIFHHSLFNKASNLNIYYFWNFDTKEIASIPVKHSRSIRKKSNYTIFRLLFEYSFLIEKIIQKTTLFLMISFTLASVISFLSNLSAISSSTWKLALFNLVIYNISTILLWRKNKQMTNSSYKEIY